MTLNRHLQLAVLVLATVASSVATAQTLRPSVSAIDAKPPIYRPEADQYPFANVEHAARFDQVFHPPTGFRRIAVADRSYGHWLRGLPVRLDRQHVESFRGNRLSSPSAAIIAIDVGTKNLQQCADSAIRLHAEYLWSQKRSGELAYHFTSGDKVRFEDWVAGERIIVDGAKVKRRAGSPRAAGHASMRRWLDLVFMYAGTRSLHRDSRTVAPVDAQPGDFFVSPGSPGHAVVVLDVARSKDGRRVALLGQGFMPAQDFHVIRGAAPQAIDGAWFVLPNDDDDELDTPSWRPFKGADLRRFGR